VSKRIVIADDEAHILRVMSMKLTKGGYEVMMAVDCEEALDLCASEKPDLLIPDYQMPLMSGLELCKRLRSNEQTRNIPAIMLTARGFDIEPAEMVAAGITAVLAKPFSPREVLAKVNDLLDVPEAPSAS